MPVRVIVAPQGARVARGIHPLSPWLDQLGAELAPDAVVAVSARRIGDRLPMSTGTLETEVDLVSTRSEDLELTYQATPHPTLGEALVKAGRAGGLPVEGHLEMPLDSGHWTPLVPFGRSHAGARVVATRPARIPLDALVSWGALLARTLDQRPTLTAVMFTGCQAPTGEEAPDPEAAVAWNDQLMELLASGMTARVVLEGTIGAVGGDGGLPALALLGGLTQGRRAVSIHRGRDGSLGALVH